ncbi:MAG: GDSL-type esterase/lipase family protein [Thermoanaerobaculia bacterium]
MTLRSPFLFVAALLLLGPFVPVARADEPIVLIAFGDSITEGYGDTSSLGGGYTKRLDRWIDQSGHNCRVDNHGVGGETSSQGLSRVDSVLAEGGDFFLLMEGTNDISHRTGIESIRFNLNEMATRAEALGMVAVHATPIPRIPTALVDADNTATAALAATLRQVAADLNRGLVDNFAVFEGLPGLFDNYYYLPPGNTDPVGHPNTDGYMQIAGTFLETLLPLLDAPRIQIIPPDGGTEAGALTSFGIGGIGSFTRVEWTFGDGGFTVTMAPGDLSTFYLYLEPGTYTVSVRGFTAQGAVSVDTATVEVTGNAAIWPSRTSLLPVVVESNDGLLVSDLTLVNGGAFFAIAEVEFLPEVRYDVTPPVRRFLLNPQTTITLKGVLPFFFGIGSGRGALKVEMSCASPGALGTLVATALVHAASDPTSSNGAAVHQVSSLGWSSSSRELLEIPYSAAAPPSFVLANLDASAGIVRVDLFDATSAFIGSAVLDLGAGASRVRALPDLFRGLETREAPFQALFGASTVRYSVATVSSNPTTGRVEVESDEP